jgi:hypothetical protein
MNFILLNIWQLNMRDRLPCRTEEESYSTPQIVPDSSPPCVYTLLTPNSISNPARFPKNRLFPLPISGNPHWPRRSPLHPLNPEW